MSSITEKAVLEELEEDEQTESTSASFDPKKYVKKSVSEVLKELNVKFYQDKQSRTVVAAAATLSKLSSEFTGIAFFAQISPDIKNRTTEIYQLPPVVDYWLGFEYRNMFDLVLDACHVAKVVRADKNSNFEVVRTFDLKKSAVSEYYTFDKEIKSLTDDYVLVFQKKDFTNNNLEVYVKCALLRPKLRLQLAQIEEEKRKAAEVAAKEEADKKNATSVSSVSTPGATIATKKTELADH